MSEVFHLVGADYPSTSAVPRDHDIFYRCLICRHVVPSVPRGCAECECGNVAVDADMWRLAVDDLSKLEVLRRSADAIQS